MPNASATRRRLTRTYYESLKVLCPGLRNSQFAYVEALQEVVRPGVRWLDLGCGHQLFPDWMPDALSNQLALVNRCAEAVGVDAADFRPHSVGLTKVAADIEQLPFADETFSLVTANMVVEHVRKPERLLRDIRRFATESGLATRFIRHIECTAQGVMLGPLVVLELLVIRTLRLPIFENYRSDLLVMLEKPENGTVR